MEEILLNMKGLFEGLEAQQIPLNQLPNLSINTEELPMLQGWEIGAAGQTLTPTEPAQPHASDLAKEEIEEELVHKSKSLLGPDPILEGSKGPQLSAATTRQILTENPNIAHRMVEHLMTHPGKALQPEVFQTTAKPIGDQPWAEGVQEGIIDFSIISLQESIDRFDGNRTKA